MTQPTGCADEGDISAPVLSRRYSVGVIGGLADFVGAGSVAER